jgi:hypothetical protein
MRASAHHVVCVLDEGQTWEARVVNLLRSLRWYGGSLRSVPFTAIAMGTVSNGFRRDVDELGGCVEKSDPPLPGYPFMNKTVALRIERTANLVVLDCDTAVVGDLGSLRAARDEIRVKPADACPFGAKAWSEFDAALGPLRLGTMRTTTTNQSIGCYPNSGVIVVGANVRQAVHDAWISSFRRATKVAEDVLPDKAFYAEQVALGAAIVSSGATLVELSVDFNWPAHLEPTPDGHSPVPRLIHYHGMCSGYRIVAPLAPMPIQRRLDQLACAGSGPIADQREEPFDRTALGVAARSTRLRQRAMGLSAEGVVGRVLSEELWLPRGMSPG